MHIAIDRRRVAFCLGVGHQKENDGAVYESGRSPKGHKRIHIRCFMHQRLKAADKEFLVDHHHGGGQKQLKKPHCHMVIVEKRRKRKAPHHMSH